MYRIRRYGGVIWPFTSHRPSQVWSSFHKKTWPLIRRLPLSILAISCISSLVKGSATTACKVLRYWGRLTENGMGMWPCWTAHLTQTTAGWTPSRWAMLSLAALIPVVVNTSAGIHRTPVSLMEVARVYGYTRWQTVTQVVLPSAIPSIFTGVYLALIYSWLATIGAEYLLVSGRGVGNLLIEGSVRPAARP